MWKAVIERFERHAPASVMIRLALEHALPAQWVNEVFEAHRQRQYPRELMFSSIVELMTLVTDLTQERREILQAGGRRCGWR